MVRLRVTKPRKNRSTSKRARRNPVRTVGAVVINPRVRRNKRRRSTRRANPVVVNRRRVTRRRRANPRRRTSARRRVSTRRANPRRRHARRRNPVIVNRRRRHTRRRANPRRTVSRMRTNRRHRRNPVRRMAAPRLSYRKNPRRRRRSNPRRHGMVRRNPMSNIPVIGSALGFLAPAGFGAISVYPTLKVVEMMERWFPSMRADVAFAISGVALGTLVKVVGGKIPGVSKYKNELAIALASAGGAVGAYKYLTGAGGGSVAAEKAKAGFYGGPGAFAGPWAGVEGLGDAGYIVQPTQPNYYAGSDSFGAMYDDSSPADMAAMGAYGFVMSPLERQAALAGPAQWRAVFPVAQRRFSPGSRNPQRLSAHAGQEGHRWGWLLKAIGPEQFQRFAELKPEAQDMAIRKLLPQFQLSADAVMDQMPAMAGFVYGD